ncbi:globoside alpha-1,3-N-acetylgalactosaminyltransferase 1-like [Oryzias latipes]|uniref:Globoside alpha-1,3-N-acetylgalactosaminyltransferase 1-like n=1 Tax=Oryzias latipes TaxID=8090 RepID=A0A3B3IEY7_ORYLA|nr:globoside alpha-1,3-N-acetylgalactosaminyltransferase 1-like [Oryzias latipes]
MALCPFCRTASGLVKIARIQILLGCFVLCLIIYFLNAYKVSSGVKSVGMERTRMVKDMTVVKAAQPQTPLVTPWGAPLVWGDIHKSSWRRDKLVEKGIHIGLLVLVVGTYAQFVHRFLSSAETYFLPDQMITYYILTDNPRSLDPAIELGLERQIKVIPIAEVPGWDRLYHRRMALVADTIKNTARSEVEYIFCADVDQAFVGPVGEEILGDLVATLHPELFGMPRSSFPYEATEESSAYVEENEGDYYYSSELYGGLVSEVYKLARMCSLLILQDRANKVTPRGLEESYLNRYLIDHRPTRVLSPEYSWWDSTLAGRVPRQRLISIGRQCEAYDIQMKEQHKC